MTEPSGQRPAPLCLRFNMFPSPPVARRAQRSARQSEEPKGMGSARRDVIVWGSQQVGESGRRREEVEMYWFFDALASDIDPPTCEQWREIELRATEVERLEAAVHVPSARCAGLRVIRTLFGRR